jgi:hypothetical protein
LIHNNSSEKNKHDLNTFFELNYDDLLPKQQNHLHKTINQNDSSFYVVDTFIPILEENIDAINDKKKFFILDTYWIDKESI